LGLSPGADPWGELEKIVGEYMEPGQAIEDVLIAVSPHNQADYVFETLQSAARMRNWASTVTLQVQPFQDWLNDTGDGPYEVDLGPFT